MEKTVIANESNFEELINTDKPVLIDFWAQWCGPCRMIAPVIEQLAHELDGQVIIAKVDIDDNQELATKYGVRSIPTLMVFKNGQVVEKMVGVRPKEKIADHLTAHL